MIYLLMISLVTIAMGMNWKKNEVLNPNAHEFAPRFPFEKGTVYHLDDDVGIGYLKRNADGQDYCFSISEASGKSLLVSCEVDFQIVDILDHVYANVIRTRNYGFDDLMQAVKRNDIDKLHKILTELELDDLEYAISCVMTQEWNTGNTVLHVAKNENIYSILFGVFWFSKDANQLLEFVTQKNWLNETPLVNAIEQNNEKMVNMLLNVLKEQAPHKLLTYIMERNDKSRNIFMTRPFDFVFSYDHDALRETFMQIWQHYGNNLILIHYFMDTMNDFETILHKTAHAKDINLFLFIINVFLRTKQHEKLMSLLMQKDLGQNTALHNLVRKKHFFTLKVLLQQCKKLGNKENLLKLLLCTNGRDGTILHFVCRQKMSSKTRIVLLETMLNIFTDKHDLMKFVTQKDRDSSKMAVEDLINLDYPFYKKYFKIIWKYLSIMMAAPECYLGFENIGIFQIKIFAEKFGIYEKVSTTGFVEKFTENPKYALQDIVKQYETLKMFKICNFVGRYKQVQIPAFNRFKI